MADKSNNDDANERPQDWEILSLSALGEPKPSGDTSSSDNTDGDVGPSSTRSCTLQFQGISDYQMQSKYYGIPSSSSAGNPNDEGRNKLKVEECALVGGTSLGVEDSGTAVNTDGVGGVSAELSKVDWMEPSPLFTSTITSESDEACKTVLQFTAVKNEKADKSHQASEVEDLHPPEKAEDQHSSGNPENEQADDEHQFTTDISHAPSKILTDYSSTTGTVQIFHVDIPGEGPQIYSCLDSEEVECLAGIEREILAEPEYTYSETFNDTSTEFSTENVEPISEKPPRSNSKKAWWKQQVDLLSVQVSQASALWSLALAAAVMGLVLLGQRWQNERLQNQHLRLQLGSKDEKINQLIFQISRLKDVISGRRRVPVVRS